MAQPKLKTQYQSPQQSPGFLLWQISNKWQTQQKRALAKLNLTHVQFVLLACIVWELGNIEFNQKQLATYAKTDPMMTSQVLRSLEKKQLLTRKPSKTDGRTLILNPTPTGIDRANKAVKVVEEIDKAFFSYLGPEKDQFTKLMLLIAN